MVELKFTSQIPLADLPDQSITILVALRLPTERLTSALRACMGINCFVIDNLWRQAAYWPLTNSP
jgi:hypothetical protein